MANNRQRANSAFSTGDIGDLIGTGSSKKRGRHIGFREIRFKAGRVEFDYTVNYGKITNEGTMVVRYHTDDDLGKLSKSLAEQFAELYAEAERG